MGKEQKCILCETVYNSKLEMEEHMRSMLHHRELENLKGRDCGHECRVCGMIVVSLTDYASHISSPVHKQRIEDQKCQPLNEDKDEEYFDKEFVQLIEKRREMIRSDTGESSVMSPKTDMTAHLDFHTLGHILHHCLHANPPLNTNAKHSIMAQTLSVPLALFCMDVIRIFCNCHHKQLPTWTVEEAAAKLAKEQQENMRRWREERSHWQGPRPLISLIEAKAIGRILVFHPPTEASGLTLTDRSDAPHGMPKDLPTCRQRPFKSFEGQTNNQQNPEELSGEHDLAKAKCQKTEKVHRWTPYPPAKVADPLSQPNPPSQPNPTSSSEKSDVESIKNCYPNKHAESGASSAHSSKTNLVQDRSQDSKYSHTSSDFSQHTASNAEKEHLLSDMLRKAKETLLNRKSSVDSSGPENCLKGTKTAPQIKEPQQVESLDQNKNKKICERKKKCNKQMTREQPAFVKHRSINKDAKLTNSETFGEIGKKSSSSLQSLQVSTSTMDHEDEEECGEREENPHLPVQDQVMDMADEGLCSSAEGVGSSPSQPTEDGLVPSLSKLALPACLKRDLSRHMGTKSKATGHEPNLNNARRIRNVSDTRKNESEKDSGLKPTLQQLIGSSSFSRNVNWDQVYQEVNRKKQEQGKGLPRFGIEMVPCEPEGLNQMDENDVPLCEGFHWESVFDISQVSVPSRKRSLSESSMVQNGASDTSTLLKAVDPLRGTPVSGPSQQLEREEKDHLKNKGLKGPPQGLEDVEVDIVCTSETELNDTQEVGKKRRAPGDVLSTEIPSEDRKNKRQKIKAKKECSPVDQLLAISLREEELNISLQTVDNSLIEARAALQAAYLEVQRLLMVKQQVTTEMNTLRTKRIEILQEMQGEFDVPERKKDETVTPSSAPISQINVSNPTTTAHSISPSTTTPPPVAIKQEPISPSNCPSERDLPGPHRTTPVQTEYAACQTDTSFKFSKRKDSSQESISMSFTGAPSDHRTEPSPPTQTESHQSAQEGLVNPPSPLISVKLAPKLQTPFIQLETSPVKRVRKLKKRKCLKKAMGDEQPQISDSELEQPISRPLRKLRPQRRSNGTSASTYTAQEKDINIKILASKANTEETELVSQPMKVGHDSDSSELEMVELPPQVPKDIVNLDTSDSDEMPEKKTKESVTAGTVEHATTEPQNLACDEVTSTSEIGSSSTVKTCESEIKSSSTIMESKVPPDVSDPGEEDMPSEGKFEGHQEAVNAMQIHNGLLFTCSGDRTIRAFNLVSRECVSVFEGHSSKVNCLVVSSGCGMQQRLYSGSSDQTIRCYSLKTTACVEQMCLPDRVLCLHIRWKILYVGLANGTVVSFSLRNNKQLDVFECHGPRAVSCLATAQEGARRVLLVGSYDTTISVRDAKNGLLLRTLEGHTKTVLCMKVVNDLVFSGSSDQSVHAHNIHTGELVRIYKGHSHAVTVVAILGKVMVTACLDKLVRVYELQSHDRLQVYGGHSDMVMCMVIHKSMIYTGCYDGSVQAVRLNLIQNYRCWWHGCTLIFGVMEHLKQHLLNDHSNPAQQTFKCRWRNCDSFFTTRNGSRQAVHSHMEKHAEENSKMDP
ncbi:Zinc finger protein 106 [Triplophysa tibetana]|uniref:Zinc finger protein 106 n=1 Tax=Triplophysa tibetana TaxID=1572043 RepID=A0A5A9NQR4_9TELE|nr:Zinc finger protein 106 [Triplophysa tibetana]